MRKIMLLLLVLISYSILAQNDNNSKFWDNVRFGGGFGFGFGSNNTTIAISPSAIYEFNETFALGLTTSYLYAKNNDLKSNVFGVGTIALFDPIEKFQLSVEFEQLFVNQKLGFFESNYNYPALYLGAAYKVGSFAAGIRFDALYDENKSIYLSAFSPIVRFYF